MKYEKKADLTWISISLTLPTALVILSGCGRSDDKAGGPGRPAPTALVRPASLPGVDITAMIFVPSTDGNGQPLVHQNLNAFCDFDPSRGLSANLVAGQTWKRQRSSLQPGGIRFVVDEERIIEKFAAVSGGPANPGSTVSVYTSYSPIGRDLPTLAFRDVWEFLDQTWQFRIEGIAEQIHLLDRFSTVELLGYGAKPFCPGSEVVSSNGARLLGESWEEGRVQIATGLNIRAFRGISRLQEEHDCADGSRQVVHRTETRIKTFDGWTSYPDRFCDGQDLKLEIEYRNVNEDLVLTETSLLLSVPSP